MVVVVLLVVVIVVVELAAEVSSFAVASTLLPEVVVRPVMAGVVVPEVAGELVVVSELVV